MTRNIREEGGYALYINTEEEVKNYIRVMKESEEV